MKFRDFTFPRRIQTTLIVACAVFTSCAYRLSNLNINSPSGIHSVAVEGVYDTSGEVLPHELLWSELQRAFAANGHLRLTTAKRADALIRAHISTASSVKSGERSPSDSLSKNDPELFDGRKDPPAPSILRDLSTSHDFFKKETLSYSVEIEVYHLETKKLLLQRTYPVSAEILAAGRASSESLTFARFDEARTSAFQRLARAIAETVVSDLLVR